MVTVACGGTLIDISDAPPPKAVPLVIAAGLCGEKQYCTAVSWAVAGAWRIAPTRIADAVKESRRFMAGLTGWLNPR